MKNNLVHAPFDKKPATFFLFLAASFSTAAPQPFLPEFNSRRPFLNVMQPRCGLASSRFRPRTGRLAGVGRLRCRLRALAWNFRRREIRRRNFVQIRDESMAVPCAWRTNYHADDQFIGQVWTNSISLTRTK